MTILVLAAIYLLPTIIASARGKAAYLSIGVINLFLGWTLIGWVLALAWAVGPERKAVF